MSKRTLLAAELTRRIPALAQDCAVNNERVIAGLIEEHLGPEFDTPIRVDDLLDYLAQISPVSTVGCGPSYQHVSGDFQNLGFTAKPPMVSSVVRNTNP